MRKILIAAAVILVFAIAFIYMRDQGPDIRKYEHLKKPILGMRESEKMLAIRIKGDPNYIWTDVVAELQKAFVQLEGIGNFKMTCPRVRVKGIDSNGQADCEFGIPIPETVNEVPKETNSIYKIEIRVWKYGPVGEILHIGPYDDEGKSIETLKKFISGEGFRPEGYIEREYVKGPGKIFKVDPNDYGTLLRFAITR